MADHGDDGKKRKYKLFNAGDERPSSEKPCAFFATPEGVPERSKLQVSARGPGACHAGICTGGFQEAKV